MYVDLGVEPVQGQWGVWPSLEGAGSHGLGSLWLPGLPPAPAPAPPLPGTPPSLPRTQSHNTPWAAALWTALIAEHLLSQHQVQLPIIRSMTAIASPPGHCPSPERTVPAATHPGSRHSLFTGHSAEGS